MPLPIPRYARIQPPREVPLQSLLDAAEVDARNEDGQLQLSGAKLGSTMTDANWKTPNLQGNVSVPNKKEKSAARTVVDFLLDFAKKNTGKYFHDSQRDWTKIHLNQKYMTEIPRMIRESVANFAHPEQHPSQPPVCVRFLIEHWIHYFSKFILDTDTRTFISRALRGDRQIESDPSEPSKRTLLQWKDENDRLLQMVLPTHATHAALKALETADGCVRIMSKASIVAPTRLQIHIGVQIMSESPPAPRLGQLSCGTRLKPFVWGCFPRQSENSAGTSLLRMRGQTHSKVYRRRRRYSKICLPEKKILQIKGLPVRAC